MPAAIPFVAAAFSAVASAAATFGATLMGASGLAAAVSAWGTVASLASLAVSLSAKPPGLDSAGYELNTALAGPQGYIPIVFGRGATGGQLVFRESSGGRENKDLFMASVLSAGPIQAFDGYYIENKLIYWNTSPFRSGSTTGLSTCTGAESLPSNSKLWKNQLRAAVTPGAHNDARSLNTLMGGGVPSIYSVGRVTGLSTLAIKATLDSKGESFTGEPGGYAVLRGQICYDPRRDDTQPGGSGAHRLTDLGTYEWSENPIICGLNWTLGRKISGKPFWGIGADLAEIDLPAFVAAANVADANAWTLGGLVSDKDNRFAVLSQMLAAGGAVPVARGSQISLYQNAPRTSVLTINADDIVGTIRVTASATLRDRINRVVPKYREPSNFWEFIDGEGVTSSTYLTEDGDVPKSDEVEFALVTKAAQAKQLATYHLANSREMIDVDLVGKPRLLNADVGQCVTLNCGQVEITGQKFLVVSRTWNPTDQTVSLSLKSETDAKHAFALGQTALAPPSPTLSTFDPTNPEPPGPAAWTISSTSITGPDGTSSPAIVLDGALDNPNVTTIQFHHRLVGSATWTAAGLTDKSGTHFEITGLQAGQNYEAGVSYGVAGYSSTITALPPVTVGYAVATTVKPGGINWDDLTNPPVSPLANVPVALTDLTSAGNLRAERIEVAGTTLAAAHTALSTGKADASRVSILETQIQTPTTGLLARTGSLETATTNLQTTKADASRVSVVEASAARDSAVTLNPNFGVSTWANGAAPSGWGLSGGTAVNTGLSRVAGQNSPNALRMNVTAGNWAGITADAPTHFPAPAGGWQVLEMDVKLLAGTWRNTELQLTAYTAGFATTLKDQVLSLRLAPDVDGVVSLNGTVGKTSRFRVLFNVPAPAGLATDRWVMTLRHGYGRYEPQASTPAADIEIHRATFRPATAAEIETQQARGSYSSVAARITAEETATADLYGRTQARWAIGAAVPGAEAFISAQAETTPGSSPTSSVAIGARQFAVFNQAGGDWKKALEVSGGNVVLTGGLQAGAFIRLGNGSGWPVALKAVDFSAGDGDVVSFGTDLGSLPSLAFAMNNLAPLSAGETYDVRATSLTATGFSLWAKINVPGTPSAFDLTTSTTTTVFGSGGRKINKTGYANSTDGTYRLTAAGTNRHDFDGLPSGFPAGADDVDYAFGEVQVWAKKGGVWGYITSVFVGSSADRRVGTGFHAVAANWSLDEDVQLGDSVQEVGLRHVSTDAYAGVASFTHLRWTAPGTAGSVRSATPSGQKTRVTVRP